ncbi:SHOCT domain-containing protein [Haloarchaeobius sp. HRN-SO-5]|uniref:SHOCT domain-containing protein n=1 Tax=Haloarchaeobius sp. HRN-SO-5 TaxID=3446118 RepID=UPI003EBD9571
MVGPPAFVGGIGGPELVIILLVFSLPVALVMLAAIVHAARGTDDETPGAPVERDETASNDRALEELRIAYARGDVDDEEYRRRKRVLERDREVVDREDAESTDRAR